MIGGEWVVDKRVTVKGGVQEGGGNVVGRRVVVIGGGKEGESDRWRKDGWQ